MEAFQSDIALALLQDLLERFKSLVIDEAGQIVQFDAEDELKKLERKLLKAQVLLGSFQLTTDKNWQHWVGDVTRVCYDAEDLVDDIVLDAGKTSLLEKILSYFTRGSMARKIQELQDRLEDIISGLDMVNKTKQRAQQCYLGEFVYGNEQLLLTEKLFGRDADKENIISMLLEQTISSVSIVGMDGLGKTTLAQNMLYDSRIQEKFHHRVWVRVSAKFDLRKITDFILHRRQECEYSFLPEKIHCLFHDLYMGKSILIVLDDLWDVKYDDWRSFRSLFLRSSGCKVLLTTSNPNVTTVTKATPYHLQLMKDEDCQALIMDRVFSSNNLSERQLVILEDIAVAVAQKCKGLPLAANVLGLHLSSGRRDDEWMNFLDRDICELRVFKEEIFPAFRLNNPCLASHLKKCLAYCSLFPHDYDFKKENLVQLWMSEGFFLPQRMTSLEQIGSDCFDELLWRSVFQLSHVGDQELPTYKMHEFIRRFAEFVASDTCFRWEEGQSSFSVPWYKTARHLSLLCDCIKPAFLKYIENCDGLRTFLLLSEKGTQIGQLPYSLFQKLVRLRVLDLSHTDIDELPESLGRLKYLRYFDASQTHILRLPKSVTNLHQLQVLRLRECYKLLELPKNIKNLTNLLHLDVDIKGLRCRPASIGSLSCLKTLPSFAVCKKVGYRIAELKNLKNLCGTICLSNLENVKDGAEARDAMICDKPYIKRLELEWSRFSRDGSIEMDVLAGLQPDKNLKELQVINYGGSSFPAWLTSPSCMLVSIYMQNCRQDDFLPSLGQLPFLKTLHVEGMHSVKYVDYHFCGESTTGAFPSLESLKIQDMMCLMSWYPLSDNSLLQLRDLTIEDCPSLFSMQSLKHMSSLQELVINCCPGLETLPQLPGSVQSLIIFGSDMVKQRCQIEEGPEWNMIKTIPYVEIDYESMFPGDSS